MANFVNLLKFISPNQRQLFSEIHNHPLMIERRNRDGSSIDLAELSQMNSRGKSIVDKASTTHRNWITKIAKVGYKPTTLADSFAITFGGLPFLIERIDFHKKEMKGTVPDSNLESLAKDKAFVDLFSASEEVQQSASQDRISNEQANAMTRLLLTFSTTQQQYMRASLKAGRDLINGRGNPVKNASIMMYYLGVQNVMFQVISNSAMFLLGADSSEEEDDETYSSNYKMIAAETLKNVVVGFGVYGKAIALVGDLAMAINKIHEKEAEGGKMSSSGTKYEVQRAIRGFAPVVGAKWREIESAMTLYSQRKDKPIQSITRGIETVTSIPTYQIFEMVEGGLDAFTTENSETIRALRFLGYSRYKFQEGAVKENTLIDEWNAHLSEKLFDLEKPKEIYSTSNF